MQPNGQQNYWQPDDSSEELRQAQSEPDLTEQTISWEASEYIHHEKDARWFGVFAIVVVAILAIALFVLRNFIIAVLVVAMAVALFAYARRPPRTARYVLNGKGLHIGQEYRPLSDYRAFGVIQDGAFYAIMLLPVQRFALATYVYFPEEEGEKIVDLLGAFMPMEPVKLDPVDTFIRKIRL